MKRTKQVLPCQLTDHELAGLADEITERHNHLVDLKEQKDLSNKSFKKRIDAAEEGVEETKRKIEDRTADREVECAEIVREKERSIVTIRLDTGEEVTRRAIMDEELQLTFTDAAPTTDAEVADKSEQDRIVGLFELHDQLKEVHVNLGRNLAPLWQITNEQAEEARTWIAARKEWMQTTKVSEEDTGPAAPQWLVDLESETAKVIEATGREALVRAETIQKLLSDQTLTVSVDEILTWPKDQQDQVMTWTDSLVKDKPLPRPPFLDEYDPQMKLAPAPSPEAEVADAGQTTEEAEAESAAATPSAQDPVELGNIAPEDLNGHMTAEDLTAKISECGVDLKLSTVQEWGEPETREAETWVTDTLKAIEGGTERKPAPDFFFK